MATLSADIEKLEEAVKILCDILPQFDDLKLDLNNITNELNNSWDGAASEYYVSILRQQAKPLNDLQQALVYFKEYAEESKYNMQKLDEIINNIFANPVFDFLSNGTGSSTHTGSSGATHGGGGVAQVGAQISSGAPHTGTNTIGSLVQDGISKVVDTVVDITQNIVGGIKAIFGGK